MTHTDQQNVPKLRFPGFEGAWTETRLGEITRIYDGTHQTPKYVKEGVPFFSVEHVTANQFTETKFISKEVFDLENKRVKLERDDILMTRIGDIGTARLIDWDVEASFYVSLALLKQNPSDFISGFLSAYIHSSYVARELYRRTIHVAFPKKINLGEISHCKLHIPTLPEQRKIAAFIGAVDKKTAQLAEKKRLLEDYKKGCMQQLFSQKIRFKDDTGNDLPDWKEKRLGEVFTWINTNSLSRERLTYDGGQVQNIHYGDIHTKFAANFHQDAEPVPYIKDATPADFKPEQFCKVGDVVIADASEDHADIGKAIEIVSVGDLPMVAGLHTYIARPKPATVQTGFAGYLLRSAPMRRQIERIAQGISVLGISKGNLEKLTFFLPHPDEQRKIANFLSTLDRKIDLVGQEIDHARTFKQGLLQQMFV